MMVKIPIQNIWLLMLYASEFYSCATPEQIKPETLDADLPKALIDIFLSLLEPYIHGHWVSGYISQSEKLSRVRGRIDIDKTYHQGLLDQARVHCHFQELSFNTPRHQYLAYVVNNIYSKVSQTQQSKLQHIQQQFKVRGIRTAIQTNYAVQRDRFARHEQQLQQLLSIGELLVQMQLPTQQQGAQHFVQASYSVHQLRLLFEKAMAGFYQRHLKQWKVLKGVYLNWSPSVKKSDLYTYIPKMKTDFILRHRSTSQCILVDTKFTNILTTGHYDGRQMFKSQYLYQMYSYLRSQEYAESRWTFTDGLLLHASLGTKIQDMVEIQGYRIHYATIDLNQDRSQIELDLLNLVKQMMQKNDA